MIWESEIVEFLDDRMEPIAFETGCYGFGSWYWGTFEALRNVYADVFPESAAMDEDYQYVNRFVLECSGVIPDSDDPDLLQYAAESSDVLLDRMNARTPEGYIWHFHDGELFLSPMCDDETCGREDCASCNWF